MDVDETPKKMKAGKCGFFRLSTRAATALTISTETITAVAMGKNHYYREIMENYILRDI